ncbi:hypothetical protein AB2T63_04805 [Clostridium butyricum]|uniref:hypothetical protein n=1 Tax=Clostridium butyricum TaxID=1492 RepID=UPI0005EB0B36|nr:hypothetical protein [Clostridium butyricum]
MDPKRCIYCGKEESKDFKITKSDIIPDALSYRKILNPNVCAVEHNQKFSDKFESKVIDELAVITNTLDIYSSKSKKYASYPIKLEIDGEAYNIKRYVSKSQLFRPQKKLISIDGKYLLGAYDEFVHDGKREIKRIDINKMILCNEFSLPHSIFYSLEMFRLMSKIAFEWYCKENNILDRDERFAAIIKYITDGTSTTQQNFVDIINDKDIYIKFNETFETYSTVLFSYEDEYGNVFCIIDLYGMVLYRVWLCVDKENLQGEKRLFLLESMIDGSKTSLNSKSFDSSVQKLKQSQYAQYLNGCYKSKDESSANEFNKIALLPFLWSITKEMSVTKVYSKETSNLIIERMNRILQNRVVHKKGIKRFVKEYDLVNNDKFNENNSSGQFWFNLLIVYIIGKENVNVFDNKVISQELEKQFPDKDFRMVPDRIKEIKNKIISDNEYKSYIKKGANIINKWD